VLVALGVPAQEVSERHRLVAAQLANMSLTTFISPTPIDTGRAKDREGGSLPDFLSIHNQKYPRTMERTRDGGTQDRRMPSNEQTVPLDAFEK
jgi:hypothetical protein